jgi:uncharacterized protein (DUF736 family)
LIATRPVLANRHRSHHFGGFIIKGRLQMMIGKFTANGDGYKGSINALGVSLAAVTFSPMPVRQGHGPDFVVIGAISGAEFEIGAAWKKTSKAGKAYLSVKLDGPTLAAPINCALTSQLDGSFALVWNRRDEVDEQAAA